MIDRLAWWYACPREWLKKIALMDDVYLLNNPFTFQSMEKHAAYCAMLRLGLKVPDTWMVPHKVPPDNERFHATAERYNAPVRARATSARQIGYPLYMKPFDGGQWVGVTRIADEASCTARYDASGERLMHLQRAVEPIRRLRPRRSRSARRRCRWRTTPAGRCTTATRCGTASSPSRRASRS